MYFQNQKGHGSGSMFQSINLKIPSSSGMLLTYIYPADSSLSIYIIHHELSTSCKASQYSGVGIGGCKKNRIHLNHTSRVKYLHLFNSLTNEKKTNHTPTKKNKRIHNIYSPPNFTSYLSIYMCMLFPHVVPAPSCSSGSWTCSSRQLSWYNLRVDKPTHGLGQSEKCRKMAVISLHLKGNSPKFLGYYLQMVVVFSHRNATWKWKMAVFNLKCNYYWRDPCFLLPWLWEDRISFQFSSIERKQTKCISRHAKRTSAITISVWGSTFVVGVMKQHVNKNQPGTMRRHLQHI